jgi:hypothetical protein
MGSKRSARTVRDGRMKARDDMVNPGLGLDRGVMGGQRWGIARPTGGFHSPA